MQIFLDWIEILNINISQKGFFFFYCNTTDKNDLNNFKKKIKKISENNFKIIIDDGSHLLKGIIHNLKFFFRFLDKDGYYIIEDFNLPEYHSFLNDSDGNELLFRNIIQNIKNKTFFESKILNKEDQKYLFENIKDINVYKGKMIEEGKNVSDIVFFKK